MSAKGIDEGRLLEDRIEDLAGAERVDVEEVVDFLVALPDETTVEHRIDVENLVARVPAAVEALRGVLDREGMAFEGTDAKTVRFSAFLALHVHYRRIRDLAAMERLHETHDHRFSDRPMYDAARGEYLRARGGEEDSLRAIEAFEDAIEAVPDNPWLHHALAETVADALEDDDLPAFDREAHRDRARTAIDRAIDRRPRYGRYHVTRGRLLALAGEYDRARGEIRRGIHLTDPDRTDAALRIARFQRRLLAVDIRAERERLDAEVGAVEDRIGGVEDDVDDRLEELDHAVNDRLGELDDAVEERVAQARADAEDRLDDLEARTERRLDDLEDRADDRLSAVEDGAEDRLDRLLDRADRVEERVEARLDRTPSGAGSADDPGTAGDRTGGLQAGSLQSLAFFTAALAAVVLTVDLAVSYPPAAAGSLVVMVFGGLTASLGAFTLTVGDGGTSRSEAAMLALGLLLLAGGFAATQVV